jgi:hypothetical protein
MHFFQGYVLGSNSGVEYGGSREWRPERQFKFREGGAKDMYNHKFLIKRRISQCQLTLNVHFF